MSATSKALLLDYGGVLTGPVQGSFAAFERRLGIPAGRSFDVLVAASRTAGGGLIGSLERGEITVEAFDGQLVSLLRQDGYDVEAGRLLDGLFQALEPAGSLWDVARQARAAGVITGLLSNSWGTHTYPRAALEDHFDTLVISGEVGLRKPDPAIYHLACQRAERAPEQCVFVDDLARNVEVARELGMFAVLHDGDDAATAATVAGFLGIELSVP
ncbi:MAG: HAD family phosphatase [Intrasporangiaceae bacterium]|nr:HAD family phosphatase [Intrasporangiaceae bacterium]